MMFRVLYLLILNLVFLITTEAQIQYLRGVLDAQSNTITIDSLSYISYGDINTHHPSNKVVRLHKLDTIHNWKISALVDSSQLNDIAIMFDVHASADEFKYSLNSDSLYSQNNGPKQFIQQYTSIDSLFIIRCDDAFVYQVNQTIHYQHIEQIDEYMDVTLQHTAGNMINYYMAYDSVATCQLSPPPPAASGSYYKLKLRIEDSYAVVKDTLLGFSYREKYALIPGTNDQVSFIIYDNMHDPVPLIFNTFDAQYGNNDITLDLNQIAAPGSFPPGIYVLYIKGPNKDTEYFLKFRKL